jgi:hypothetical protein
LLAAGLGGFQISTPVLHLSGAGVGLSLAVWFLRQHWVDCEGWDAFSVWAGQPGRRDDELPTIARPKVRKPRNRVVRDDDEAASTPPELKLLARLRRFLTQQKTTSALREWRRMQHVAPAFLLPEQDLFRLTDAAWKEQIWDDAIPLMEACWERYPQHCTRLRVKLADAALRIQRRPSYALKVLEGLETNTLPDDLRTLAATIASQAQQQIDEGVYELEGRAWGT